MAELKNLIVNGNARINGNIYANNLNSNIEVITYADLKSKRDSGTLTPGKQYRIADYATTNSYSYATVANHLFDIIVVADSSNKLNENASAAKTLRSSETYFDNSKLEAWEIKYCLDNDTNRFGWANTSTGKGVIYYMKDEFGNECPYDFKNIMFYRSWNSTKSLWSTISTSSSAKACYTFSSDGSAGTTSFTDYSLSKSNNIYNNVIKEYRNGNTITLNNNCFFGTYCYGNIFETGCYQNTFGNYCYSNTFGNSCYLNTFGNSCYYNTIGNSCTSNALGYGCTYNIFNDYCNTNTFGSSCQKNNIGISNASINLGSSCFYNIFGNSCVSNTFGQYCSYNNIGNGCNLNTFGTSCSNNNLQMSCSSNSLGQYCSYNVFENGCTNNTLYQSSQHNTYLAGCTYLNTVSPTVTLTKNLIHPGSYSSKSWTSTPSSNSLTLSIIGINQQNQIDWIPVNRLVQLDT